MNPSIEDRLESIGRALSDIVMPALPEDAALAREQCYLAMVHIQVLQRQLPGVSAFEQDELRDAQTLVAALLEKGEGGPQVTQALAALRDNKERGQDAATLKKAIHDVIEASSRDGAPDFRTALAKIVLDLEGARAMKDRAWFALMGFDQQIEG